MVSRQPLAGHPGLYRYKTQGGEVRYSYNFSSGGRRFNGTLPSMTATHAASAVQRLRAQALLGQPVPLKRIGFSEYLPHFLKRKESQGKKVLPRLSVYRRFAHHFGNRPLDSIRISDVQGYLEELVRQRGTSRGSELVSLSTRERHRAYLSSLFSTALSEGLVSSNPASRAALPSLPERKRVDRYLSVREYRSLVALCSPRLGALVALAVHTGMRRGELLALQWNWVDPDWAAVHLPGSICKSRRGRTIALNESAREALSYFWGNRDGDSVTGYSHFPRREWEEVIRTLGWGPSHPSLRLRRFNFHGLRHTCASWMVQRGVSLYAVRDVLGHSSIRQTEVYSHLAPSQRQEAVMELDNVISS